VGGPTRARQCATKSLADIGAGCKNLFIRVGRCNFTLTCQFTISTDSMRLPSYFKIRINITLEVSILLILCYKLKATSDITEQATKGKQAQRKIHRNQLMR
jgi:hypothetical protein